MLEIKLLTTVKLHVLLGAVCREQGGGRVDGLAHRMSGAMVTDWRYEGEACWLCGQGV